MYKKLSNILKTENNIQIILYHMDFCQYKGLHMRKIWRIKICIKCKIFVKIISKKNVLVINLFEPEFVPGFFFCFLKNTVSFIIYEF